MNEQNKKLTNGITARHNAAKAFYEQRGLSLNQLDTNTLRLGIDRAFPEDIRILMAHAPKDIPALLDIIARQDAEIQLLSHCPGVTLDGICGFYPDRISKGIAADRDRLAAECKAKDERIEALERGIPKTCGLCIHITGCQTASDDIGLDECWEFDEARFMEGGGEG